MLNYGVWISENTRAEVVELDKRLIAICLNFKKCKILILKLLYILLMYCLVEVEIVF